MQNASAVSEEYRRIPLELVIAGNNPRRYFDAAEMADLEQSVRANGVQQPILVRPSDDGKFKIVAGERRWRASVNVGLSNIPALVREMSDSEAEAISLIENIQRADMSVTEEADAAGKILARHNGDREATAGELGWTVSKLTRRLALLVLAPEVKNALDERKIQIGHAELLAAVPHDKQIAALGKIIEHNLTVAFVKDYIAKVSQRLDAAIFDKAECASCHHNSEQQSTLFSEAVANGHCTNSECYEKKSAAKIEEIRASLTDTYQTVRLIGAGDDKGIIPLVAAGNLGVGLEQMETGCKQCANYGCTVSTLPGSYGRVEENICFDTLCNQQKVAARIKTEKSAAQETKAEKPGENGKATQKAKAAAAPGAISSGMKDYRRDVWRSVAQAEFIANPDKSKAFLIGMALENKSGRVNSTFMREGLTEIAGSDVSYGMDTSIAASNILALPSGQQDALVTRIAASAMKDFDGHELTRTLHYLNADLAKHWKVNEKFLDLMTKSEIEALCDEIGLKAHLGDGYKKIMSGKKSEIIASLLKTDGFVFDGVIPRVMVYDGQ